MMFIAAAPDVAINDDLDEVPIPHFDICLGVFPFGILGASGDALTLVAPDGTASPVAWVTEHFTFSANDDLVVGMQDSACYRQDVWIHLTKRQAALVAQGARHQALLGFPFGSKLALINRRDGCLSCRIVNEEHILASTVVYGAFPKPVLCEYQGEIMIAGGNDYWKWRWADSDPEDVGVTVPGCAHPYALSAPHADFRAGLGPSDSADRNLRPEDGSVDIKGFYCLQRDGVWSLSSSKWQRVSVESGTHLLPSTGCPRMFTYRPALTTARKAPSCILPGFFFPVVAVADDDLALYVCGPEFPEPEVRLSLPVRRLFAWDDGSVGCWLADRRLVVVTSVDGSIAASFGVFENVVLAGPQALVQPTTLHVLTKVSTADHIVFDQPVDHAAIDDDVVLLCFPNPPTITRYLGLQPTSTTTLPFQCSAVAVTKTTCFCGLWTGEVFTLSEKLEIIHTTYRYDALRCIALAPTDDTFVAVTADGVVLSPWARPLNMGATGLSPGGKFLWANHASVCGWLPGVASVGPKIQAAVEVSSEGVHDDTGRIALLVDHEVLFVRAPKGDKLSWQRARSISVAPVEHISATNEALHVLTRGYLLVFSFILDLVRRVDLNQAFDHVGADCAWGDSRLAICGDIVSYRVESHPVVLGTKDVVVTTQSCYRDAHNGQPATFPSACTHALVMRRGILLCFAQSPMAYAHAQARAADNGDHGKNKPAMMVEPVSGVGAISVALPVRLALSCDSVALLVDYRHDCFLLTESAEQPLPQLRSPSAVGKPSQRTYGHRPCRCRQGSAGAYEHRPPAVPLRQHWISPCGHRGKSACKITRDCPRAVRAIVLARAPPALSVRHTRGCKIQQTSEAGRSAK
eukprot:GEMP01018336.1.p1 GENE.GEMP01018336.1~~GEMP01018336.1.p1  ORF type:complete len:879 (+),score=183.30 GEMP01018336.1:60-2639(+)